jgi:peptidoglycan/xylan/chitin deacetylase (PgdA/CDA1 family)
MSVLEKLVSAGLLGGLAAGGCVYAAKSPGSQLFGRTLVAGDDPEQIALTFDDGPNDPYTQQLLDLLARHRVLATFFLVGNYVRRRPDLARAIHQAGHLVGNHTMSHPSLMWQTNVRIGEELAGCNALLEDVLGIAVGYFRPPFGARRPDVLRAATELGLKPVMWNITAHDWDATDSQALAAKVLAGVKSNRGLKRSSNVLLHDGGHLHFGTDRSVTLSATSIVLQAGLGSYVTVDAWG